MIEGENVALDARRDGVGAGRALPPSAADLELVEGSNPFAVDGDDVVTLQLRAARWGAYMPGIVYVRGYDRFRVVRWETRLDARTPLRSTRTREYLRSIARPLRTQVFAGNQVARERGDGIEFADLRPFVAGRPRAARQLARERAPTASCG